MPAIIAHDLFAKDVYHEVFESVGGSRDEAEAPSRGWAPPSTRPARPSSSAP